MPVPPRLPPFLMALLMVGIAVGAPAAQGVREKQPGPSVARYDVFEHAIPWKSSSDPWDDVRVDVTLRSPSRRLFRIGAFYAGGDTWKLRFAPGEVGAWSWTAQVADGKRAESFRGRFTVVRGTSPGFVRRSPYNRFRWTFANGLPYYPIGINDCTQPITGDKPLAEWGLDGGFGSGHGHKSGRLVGMNEYLSAYAAAGFNLFRWGPDNCSFKLYERIHPDGNVYSQSGLAYADQLITALRRYGFRIELVLFGFEPPFAQDAHDPAKMIAVKRYVRYVVNRYGAYVDIWELMNEASASDRWYTEVAGYLRSIDPYRHPVGTNYSQPDLAVMDYGADHWYETEDELQSDRRTWERFQESTARAKGKPTLIDEQGNVGQNWDSRSGVRMRLRVWTAFFAEGTLVFWNTSFVKDYKNANSANIYLGPEERGYVRVLQNFTRGFDPRARIVSAPVSGSAPARSYALSGPAGYGLYLVAAGDHDREKIGVRVTVDPQRAGRARWLDPATGRVLRSAAVKAGKQSLDVPAFTTDIALKIE